MKYSALFVMVHTVESVREEKYIILVPRLRFEVTRRARLAQISAI